MRRGEYQNKFNLIKLNFIFALTPSTPHGTDSEWLGYIQKSIGSDLSGSVGCFNFNLISICSHSFLTA